MKKYLLLFSLVMLASCETVKTSMRTLASVKPKNYIITIHGLSGSPQSFGGLLPALEEHLSQINPNYEYIGKEFKYSSGQKGAEIERFVSEFENYLIKEIPVLNDGDRISIVAHSQGGLVGYIWYLKTLDGVDLKQKAYMEKVNGFVTLSSPFWGSRTTFLLKQFIPSEYVQNFIYENFNFGDQEVTDITAASEKIYDYFSKMASKTSVNSYYDPRMLNVIAVVPETKGDELKKGFLNSIFSDLKKQFVKIFDYRLNVGSRWESDQAVNVSSGRLGFYYYSDTIVQNITGEKKANIEMPDFEYSRFFKTDPKVIYVEGVHANVGSYPNYAVAEVPDICIEPDKCQHPTYIHILKHLANCDDAKNLCRMDRYNNIVKQLEVAREPLSKESSESIHSELRTFNLALDINFPKNFIPPKELLDSGSVMKFLQVEYLNGNDPKKQLAVAQRDGLIKSISPINFQIRLGRFREWGSRIVNYSAERNQLNIQITGNVQSAGGPEKAIDVNKKYPLQMIINIPGLKKRKMVIPLQPSYTTFLDLQLD
ncbi:hypothetical protein CIK05_13765 [Bdellovibrio sp. qaytius]|nr:hypothetical protein CIK05_13765 [Bdellovibrio sp. qaytius]